MPTKQEDKDRDAKRRAREERYRRSGDTSSRSHHRESSERREKDRARNKRDKSRDSDDSTDITPGAYASTRERRSKSGKSSSGRSSSGRKRSPRPPSGKNRTSERATIPGAVTSSSHQSRSERRKAARNHSSKSPNRSTSAVQTKLKDTGLLNEEESMPLDSGSNQDADELNNKQDEHLLQAEAVGENEGTPSPVPLQQEDIEFVGDMQNTSRNEEAQNDGSSKPKRRTIILILVVLILGACAGVGAYFGTRKTSEPPLPITSPPTVAEATAPSNAPSPLDLDERCEGIRNGTPITDPELVTFQAYDILMDVDLVSGTMNTQLPLVSIDLEEKIRLYLIPSLAGCPDQQRRHLQIETYIANALVDADVDLEATCLPLSDGDSARLCHRFIIHLYLYVENIVANVDYGDIIKTKFREAPLVGRLELALPITNATVVDILSNSDSTLGPDGEDTESPSSSDPPIAPSPYPTTIEGLTSQPSVGFSTSQAPSISTVTFPTTDSPTQVTGMPSIGPTAMPVTGPTLEPTPLPTFGPSSNPSLSPTTPGPSSMPSQSPTTPGSSSIPSLSPTVGPTAGPTATPTLAPSLKPSQEPSRFPSAVPSTSPSTSLPCIESNSELSNAVGDWFTDDALKASVEAQYGPIGGWCFGAAVTDMNGLFRDKSDFNEDISNWDVSSVTDMGAMFNRASAFNQPLSSWDVSSVTSMNGMFQFASSFNQPLSTWDVRSVTIMQRMFNAAVSFNQDLSSWNVSSVSDMNGMFWRSALDQNFCAWGEHLSPTTNIANTFRSTQCSDAQDPILTSEPPGPFCNACT